MGKAFYVTTAIPYVNAKPHIGHALEFVQADSYARFQKLLGNDVFLLTGSDDHALKNVQSAEEAGIPVREYVARNSALFRVLNEHLQVSFDHFISTSAEERHIRGSQKLWQSCRPEDIYKKRYEGLYCVGCEEFKNERDVINGECEEHPRKKLEIVQEENYFFRLSAYRDTLKNLIENGVLRITPNSRKNEILSFIDGGLEDFSVSRSIDRARGWGVPVPGDPSQIMYVWFDALANYITALDYADDGELFKRWWLSDARRVHFIGKGINRFHTLYWPAMLLSAQLPIPTEVFVHGYLTVGGQKMSKSVGNTIDPEGLIREYGVDAVRYYFLRHAHPFEDSDFTVERFKEAYNANLAHGLGNVVARIMKLAEDYLASPLVPPPRAPFPTEFIKAMESFEFNRAIDFVWGEIQTLDERITREEPFRLVKTDRRKGGVVIAELVTELYRIGRMLHPFMPEANERIQAAIMEGKKPETLFPRKD